MTLQTFARRCAAALAIAAATFTAAQAQPSAAGTVSPPVRADLALSGKVLAAHNTSDHLACQSECKGAASCTGYSFNRNAKATCTVLSGTLTDVVVTGAVSCRMPCDANPRASVLPQKLPNTIKGMPEAAALSVPTRSAPPLPPPPMPPSDPKK